MANLHGVDPARPNFIVLYRAAGDDVDSVFTCQAMTAVDALRKCQDESEKHLAFAVGRILWVPNHG